MKRSYIVYKHTNIHNGNSYIGITSKTMEQRWIQHLLSAQRDGGFKFHKAIQKYGADSFIHEILAENILIEDAKSMEIYYINQYQTFHKGYNATRGGDGTWDRTEEWCQQRSEEMKRQLACGERISPFSDPKIHQKTMESRRANNSNIFVTNNPMKDGELIKKKLQAMPDMKGRKQWINKITGERKQSITCPGNEDEWIQKGFKAGKKTKSKGVPKNKVKCPYCDFECASHVMNRHIKARHENI